MGMEFMRRLPIPQEVKAQMPLGPADAARKSARDGEVARILDGADPRLLVIAGPCSADREDAVLEFCLRLARLQEDLGARMLFVPRVFTAKPRSLGTGYKGLLHRPDARYGDDMLEGVLATRRLHLSVISQTGLFPADELLYPQQYRFVSDLLAYVSVGARSVENQEHRLVASGLDIPVGMKNPLSGKIESLANAIFAARQPQRFIYRNWEVQSSGNPYAHGILRGYLRDGADRCNCTRGHAEAFERACAARGLSQVPLIVDCSHSNSGKDANRQPDVARAACALRNAGCSAVRGIMLESYLEDGAQAPGGGAYGVSITDACMGWKKTERLLSELAQQEPAQQELAQRDPAPRETAH